MSDLADLALFEAGQVGNLNDGEAVAPQVCDLGGEPALSVDSVALDLGVREGGEALTEGLWAIVDPPGLGGLGSFRNMLRYGRVTSTGDGRSLAQLPSHGPNPICCRCRYLSVITDGRSRPTLCGALAVDGVVSVAAADLPTIEPGQEVVQVRAARFKLLAGGGVELGLLGLNVRQGVGVAS